MCNYDGAHAILNDQQWSSWAEQMPTEHIGAFEDARAKVMKAEILWQDIDSRSTALCLYEDAYKFAVDIQNYSMQASICIGYGYALLEFGRTEEAIEKIGFARDFAVLQGNKQQAGIAGLFLQAALIQTKTSTNISSKQRSHKNKVVPGNVRPFQAFSKEQHAAADRNMEELLQIVQAEQDVQRKRKHKKKKAASQKLPCEGMKGCQVEEPEQEMEEEQGLCHQDEVWKQTQCKVEKAEKLLIKTGDNLTITYLEEFETNRATSMLTNSHVDSAGESPRHKYRAKKKVEQLQLCEENNIPKPEKEPHTQQEIELHICGNDHADQKASFEQTCCNEFSDCEEGIMEEPAQAAQDALLSHQLLNFVNEEKLTDFALRAHNGKTFGLNESLATTASCSFSEKDLSDSSRSPKLSLANNEFQTNSADNEIQTNSLNDCSNFPRVAKHPPRTQVNIAILHDFLRSILITITPPPGLDIPPGMKTNNLEIEFALPIKATLQEASMDSMGGFVSLQDGF